jgi:hypothetical protein
VKSEIEPDDGKVYGAIRDTKCEAAVDEISHFVRDPGSLSRWDRDDGGADQGRGTSTEFFQSQREPAFAGFRRRARPGRF